MKWRNLGPFFIGAIIIAVGAVTMLGLLSMRKPPAQAGVAQERSYSVNAILAIPSDVPVTIRGYGEAEPRRVVTLSPEISGAVVSVNDQLVVGGLVREGETLFAIDDTRYRARLDEARALVGQWESSLERLRMEKAGDEARLLTLERSRDLSRKKLDRAGSQRDSGIGNESEVETAEQALNDTSDRLAQLRRQVNIYPALMEEMQHTLASSEAKLLLAQLDLEHTRITAPFDARVTEASVELGHFARMGETAATLADDSILEIPVKLDAREARRWLEFEEIDPPKTSAWFAGLKRVACAVRWTESPEGQTWEGRLTRVEEFDPKTRSLTVIVQVSGEQAQRGGQGFPLVAGMFCEVEIPGRKLRRVIALPQWAVSVDSTVHVADNDRLKTVAVTVARSEGGTVYVSEGLVPNDLVITTRLIDPLEGTLLSVTPAGDGISQD